MSNPSNLDTQSLSAWVDSIWEDEIVPQLTDYIRIPALSPLFDSEWEESGHLEAAVQQVEAWSQARPIAGLEVEVVRLPGRTPLIMMEIPGEPGDSVLMYGHIDKQPEMKGWREDLGPWKPVLEGDKLYGRGGADDGYAPFASLAAIEAVQKHGGKHPRCVVLIEASEESGSPDLPAYIEHLSGRIGQVGLVVCLDSGAGDYDRLWSTTSLRGMVAGDLKVKILREGVHSGDASGIVPSSFRILRMILDRIEDPQTGRLLLDCFHVEVPEERTRQAESVAQVMGESTWSQYPFVENAEPMTVGGPNQVLARTWAPTLSITGVDGLPPLSTAGNVLRPSTSVKLSFRLPPTADWSECTQKLQEVIRESAPYSAEVSFTPEKGANGWNASPLVSWLETALTESSIRHFGAPPAWMGEGGTIPFMGMLGDKFPDAQFLITGVLGPHSNAHGPNEFIHLPTAKKLTACVAEVLDAATRA
ncbi:MAG TPA: M20/M25/M40 family metallo-hydrolase [Planctomycetota bacterium]|jgi:acetylornithine deacetylase/succinyl-diaminopimelate desuccinylase-like protein|nr:peptidase M20 [Planctomycetota bacterium]MDP7245141.1 M20/M25/M40 family metallo-hydrolase [Planctomycetota bacterium]HJM40535.1 M20/M25/M40 family metallo-hydrolase [Planctomycetota bacterium]|tara:strand:- start:3309 stop:4733 length:1425 start_codon:yes stop_codon:yes gene_type:complete